MTQWQYHVASFYVGELGEMQTRLDELGQAGWELISMVAVESKSVGLFDSGSATSDFVATFKRPNE